MNYFKDCTTLNEVKATFKALAKQFHPDLSGYDTTAIMQTINKEYAYSIAKIARGENLSNAEIEAEILNAEQYRNAINAIINLEGLTIELCGGWIWVSGNTYTHKDILKNNGFYFASKKCMWYFRSVEYATKTKGKSLEMGQIRIKYGSQLINTQQRAIA